MHTCNLALPRRSAAALAVVGGCLPGLGLIGLAKLIVRCLHLHKARRGVGGVVDIGMQFEGKLSVGCFYVGGVGTGSNTQRLPWGSKGLCWGLNASLAVDLRSP